MSLTRRDFMYLMAGSLQAQDRVAIEPRKNAKSAASEAKNPQGHLPRLRSDSTLVTIPTLVIDIFGVPYEGLQKEDFHLAEDGVDQTITDLYNEDAGANIGIVFDVSASMTYKYHGERKIDIARKALKELFAQRTEGDYFMAVKFADRVSRVSSFSKYTDALEDEICKRDAGDQTDQWVWVPSISII